MYYNDDVWDRVAVGKKFFIGVFCPISQFFLYFFALYARTICGIEPQPLTQRVSALPLDFIVF